MENYFAPVNPYSCGLYLRNATYWRVHGRNTIAENIAELRRIFHRWRCRRAQRKAERKKYGHLNR